MASEMNDNQTPEEPTIERAIPIDEPHQSLDERISAELLSRGRVKESDLVRARRLYDESPDGSFVTLMSRLGLVSERDAAEAVAEVLELPLVSAKECPDAPP